MVAAYWQAWRDLQLWSHGSSSRDGMALPAGQQQAVSFEAVRETMRELALQDSQTALRQFFPGLANGDYRPVPVDQPLVASYTSHYDWYAERGRGSEELARLDAALPVLLQTLEGQAAEALAELNRPGQAETGRAMEAFLNTVCQYNSAVGHYTLTLIRNQPAPVELVRMLVPVRRATTVLVDTESARVAQNFDPLDGGRTAQAPGMTKGSSFQSQNIPAQGGFGDTAGFVPQPPSEQSGFNNPANSQPSGQSLQQPQPQDQGTQPWQPNPLPAFQPPGSVQPGANPSQPSFAPPRTNSRQPSEDFGQPPNG